MAKTPLFIAFEGIDGSGKSTQAKLLAAQFQKEGLPIYETFEPTKSDIGTIIRHILQGKRQADERTIAALFAADRLDHILNDENGILKQLELGFHVISDRYYFSSYAYHSVHMDMDWVIQTNAQSANSLRPHATIYIDVHPQTCMERIQQNRDSTELYETLDNLNRVRDNYQKAFSTLENVEKIIRIDGNRSVEVVAADVWQAVQNLMK
jgi:dTMP kinase